MHLRIPFYQATFWRKDNEFRWRDTHKIVFLEIITFIAIDYFQKLYLFENVNLVMHERSLILLMLKWDQVALVWFVLQQDI